MVYFNNLCLKNQSLKNKYLRVITNNCYLPKKADAALLIVAKRSLKLLSFTPSKNKRSMIQRMMLSTKSIVALFICDY